MIQFNKDPEEVITTKGKNIYSFSSVESKNIDGKTVASFGEEWSKFNHFSQEEIDQIGKDYFDILPNELQRPDSRALDLGCGSGRWAYYLKDKVGFVECVDPSKAVFVAAHLLKDAGNVRISRADVDTIPFEDNTFDLVYSLGVLHHIPDTKAAMDRCVRKVKQDGYFLVYLYYNLDNRGSAYKLLFQTSNLMRNAICRMPSKIKKRVCDGIAISVYWPLARFAALVGSMGAKKLAKKLPLSYYGDKNFWIMKNDALDRFGTPLEQRFSKKKIEQMMRQCGLHNIRFSEKEPYWHAIGQKL